MGGPEDSAGQHEGTGSAPAGSAAKVPYINCSHIDSLRVFCDLRMYGGGLLARSLRVMSREIARHRSNSLLPLPICTVATPDPADVKLLNVKVSFGRPHRTRTEPVDPRYKKSLLDIAVHCVQRVVR